MKKIKRTKQAVKKVSFANYEQMTGEEFHSLRRNHAYDLYQNSKTSELQNEVYKWMRNNGYDKDDIKNAKKVTVSTNIGVLCKLLSDGCPDYFALHDDYWQSLTGTAGKIRPITDDIKEAVAHYIIQGSLVEDIVEDTKPLAKVISIQDRMREQMEDLFSHIETFIDDWIVTGKTSQFDAYKYFKSFKVEIKPAHAKIIRDSYAPMCEEMELAKTDSEIKEYYADYTTAKLNSGIKFLSEIVSACDMIINEGKAQRKPRKKKAIAADKLVEKVVYKQRDTDYNLVSANPSGLVNCNEVWIFNCKTRKLAKYIADELSGPITVKRNTSTIVGWDEHKSIQKTLRKPDEQLKGFTRLGKVALRKFLDNINSKPAPLNGRINKDCIILKIA